MLLPPKPLFKLGRLLITPGALDALRASEQSPWSFISCHMKGDWGEVCTEDKQANDHSVKDESRILSAYTTAKGERLWVITEADRSATTILLPGEY